jgi:hypothetical protein
MQAPVDCECDKVSGSLLQLATLSHYGQACEVIPNPSHTRVSVHFQRAKFEHAGEAKYIGCADVVSAIVVVFQDADVEYPAPAVVLDNEVAHELTDCGGGVWKWTMLQHHDMAIVPDLSLTVRVPAAAEVIIASSFIDKIDVRRAVGVAAVAAGVHYTPFKIVAQFHPSHLDPRVRDVFVGAEKHFFGEQPWFATDAVIWPAEEDADTSYEFKINDLQRLTITPAMTRAVLHGALGSVHEDMCRLPLGRMYLDRLETFKFAAK